MKVTMRWPRISQKKIIVKGGNRVGRVYIFKISVKNAIKQLQHSLNSGVKNKRTEYKFHESNHVMAKIFTKNTLVKWAHIM